MINIEPYELDRKELRLLFLLADDSPDQVALYFALGEMLVAREGKLIVGHVQIVPAATDGDCEIKRIAVREDHQSRGIGAQLINAAVRGCLDRGYKRIILATATADVANLRFYQRHGFRMVRIVSNAFTPEKGYSANRLIDGIPLRDQIWFERDLAGVLPH